MGDEEEEIGEEQMEERTEDAGAKTKVKTEEAPTQEKSEAQLLIEAKLRKHEEEDAERLREIEHQRRIEKEKQEEELRMLKEKQAQRQKQREEEERIQEEQRKQQEEQRKRDEETRRLKQEEEKRRKQEEAERKKAAAQAAMVGGRNFTIDKQSAGESTMDRFMNISKAKTEMSLNTNELEALKAKTLSERVKPLAMESLDHTAIKALAEQLWKQIVQLETSKYDLDERLKRQEYDLKELNERQRQTNMKKYAAAGGDAEGGASQAGRHPPKVQLISKYERRTDRRTFGERKSLFEWDSSKEPKHETVQPKAKKRDNWIQEKGKEERRHTYDYPDEETNDTADHHEAEEEVNESAEPQEVAAEEE